MFWKQIDRESERLTPRVNDMGLVSPKVGSSTAPSAKGLQSGVGPIACQHRFVLLRSARWTESGGYNTRFCRLDTFFCEACLEQKEVPKDEYARETPDWYRE